MFGSRFFNARYFAARFWDVAAAGVQTGLGMAWWQPKPRIHVVACDVREVAFDRCDIRLGTKPLPSNFPGVAPHVPEPEPDRDEPLDFDWGKLGDLSVSSPGRGKSTKPTPEHIPPLRPLHVPDFKTGALAALIAARSQPAFGRSRRPEPRAPGSKRRLGLSR